MLDPIFLRLGSLEIRYYGILMALGFLIGYFIIKRYSREFTIKQETAEDFYIYALLSLIIGARLFEVLFYNPAYYFSNPMKIIAVWEGGLASHGAIILTFITALLYTKKKKIKFYDLADLFIIPIALGAAFVRIGNFVNGELVGRITTLPWAVQFAGYEGLRHPVQLYQSAYLILIFIVLLNIKKIKNRKPGTIIWSFLILDSIFRFMTEFYKDLPIGYGLQSYGLNLAQYASVVIFIISAFMIYKIYKTKNQDKHS